MFTHNIRSLQLYAKYDNGDTSTMGFFTILLTMIFLLLSPFFYVGYREYRYDKFVMNTISNITDDRSNCISNNSVMLNGMLNNKDTESIVISIKKCGINLPSYYQYNSDRKKYDNEDY